MPVAPNPLEWLLLILLGSGFGVSPGVPPAEEAPLAAKVAPADCLFYASWAGTGTPDAKSDNQTEQLLAEQEIQDFLAEAQDRMFGFMGKNTAFDPKVQQNIQNVNKLLELIRGKPGALYITDLHIGEYGPTGIKGAFLLQTGKDSAEVEKLLKNLQDVSSPKKVFALRIEGQVFHSFKSDKESPSITWGIVDDYLVAGFGDGSLEELLKRSQGEAPGWLTDIRKKLSVPRFSSVFYVNVNWLTKLATEQDDHGEAQKMLSDLGLNKLGYFAAVSGMDDKGCITRTLLSVDGKPTGLLKLIDAKPLTAEDLAPVGSDVLGAMVLKCDPPWLFDFYVDMLNQNDPRGSKIMRTSLETMKEQLGIDVREDFVNSIGDTWRLYVQPTGPAAILQGWTLAVDVRNREKLEHVHDTLIKILEARIGNGGNTPTLTTGRKINDQDVYTLDFTPLGTPFSPSWCITDKQIILAATIETLERQLTTTDKKSLAQQPYVAPLVAKDAKTLALAYANTREITETILPKLPELLQAMGPIPVPLDTSQLPSSKIFAAHLQPSVFSVRRTADGLEMTSRRTLPGGDPSMIAPVAVAAMLPAVSAARGAARRAHGMNNLRQLALGLLNFESAHMAFPAGYSADEKGKPLLSWRVHILPYLGEQELYEQFHLDEPWDSEHNKKLIEKMPDVFRSPASKAKKPGMTNYLGVGGADGIFVRPEIGGKLGTPISDVTDGTSHTIMVIEVPDKKAVIWTKPADFAPDKKEPTKGLTGLHPGGFQAGLADGSVRFITKEIDADVFRSLLTKSGGEVVDHNNF